MKVYHGSNMANLTAIDPAYSKPNDIEGAGIYCAFDEDVASAYGRYVYVIELSDTGVEDMRNLDVARNICCQLVDEAAEFIESKSHHRVATHTVRSAVNCKELATEIEDQFIRTDDLVETVRLIIENTYEIESNFDMDDDVTDEFEKHLLQRYAEILPAYIFPFHTAQGEKDVLVIKDPMRVNARICDEIRA